METERWIHQGWELNSRWPDTFILKGSLLKLRAQIEQDPQKKSGLILESRRAYLQAKRLDSTTTGVVAANLKAMDAMRPSS